MSPAQVPTVDELQAVQDQVHANDNDIADLQARVAALEASEPTPPEPTPDPVGRMGSSTNGPLFKPPPTGLGYTTAPVTRLYLRNLPSGSVWGNIVGDTKANTDTKNAVKFGTGVLWLSYKEPNKDLADAFFATMPSLTELVFDEAWGTYHHEPDNGDYPNGQAFIDDYRKHAPVIRQHGMKSVPILMRQTFQDGNFDAWWPGDAADKLGVDSYNIGNKNGKYGNVDNQMAPIWAAVDEVGLGWGVGETGALVFADQGGSQGRATWLQTFKDKNTQHGCEANCYWDQDGYALDTLGAQTWLGY